MTRAFPRVAVVLSAALTLSACGTLRNVDLWPFGGDDGPQATAAAGERIPVLTYDQTIQPTAELAGTTFELPAPRAVTEWPVPGGTPEQSVEHVQAGEGFQIAWRRGLGEGSGRRRYVTATPVAAQGRIFTMDAQQTVTAHDAGNGGLVWRVNLEPQERRDRGGFGGGVAFADGRLYVTSGSRFVAALDAATGGLIWRTQVDQPVHGAPTVAGGRVYAVNLADELQAWDATTGAQVWSYQALVEPARILSASTPAVSGETIVAPFASGELTALLAVNGTELWSEVLSRASRTNALSEIRDIPGRPVIYGGDVYAVSHSGVFSAVDLRTGEPRWSLPLTGMTTPWPAGDVVFAVSKAGELIAANRSTGQVYWLTDLSQGRVRNEGGVFGLFDREVRPIWSSPLLASGRLVLVSTDGNAVAVDARTGAVQGEIRLGSPAFISPIAANGTIYVVTEEAELIAIR